MDIKRLDDGSGIENTLRPNNAKYHNTCRLMFNNSKLERAKKRRRVSQRSFKPEAGPSTFTRRSFDTVSGIKAICFFVQEMSLGQTETL